MAVYQNSTANLGVKLEITHASPDVANNRTTITYKASVYKTGSHNPWNALSQTPMYLTINGQSLHSTATGNYDLRSSTYQQVIKTGTLVIPHNTDGSKSFTFSWNVNFTSTGYGYGNVTTSGTYVLPNIARASTFTIPSTTITTGSAFTVTITKASDGFRHKVAYIVGSSENEWITNADKTYSATIPHSLFNAYKSSDSVSGVIRVTTMNGTTVVGSNQQTVTINLASSAIPSLAGVSYTNSNKGMFTGTNQFIRNVSLPTITAGTATGSYSSTISSYEFQTLRNTSTVLETISKTANSQQFGAFNFPTSGSEAKVYMQARVRDSRGRYSAWVKTPELRVHHYSPPAIGTMTVKRTGSGNTTLQVTRNYVVTNMFEGGGTTNSNTASLTFQHRTKGSSTTTNNTGAGSTTMTLTNSNANLAGTFAANTSYEVRAILKDKLNTVYGSWISVGTEFVPMDIGPKGVGVGKIHSDASYDLEVGSGGATIDGALKVGSTTISSSGVIQYSGSQIQLKQLTAHNGYLTAQLSSTGDFNSDTKTGFSHMSPSATNSPGSWGILRSVAASDTHVSQIYHERDGYNKLFTRAKTNGEWKNWNEVAYANGTMLAGGQDLNHDRYRTQNGRWFSNANATVATLINAPDANAGWMEVVTTGSMSYQTWYSYAGGNIFFRRYYQSWGPWYNISSSTTSGDESNGRWHKMGDLLICSIRFVLNDYYSSYTLKKRWTYPKAFTQAPSVTLTGRTNIGHMESTNGAELNGTLQTYAETATYCDIAWFRQGGSAYVSGNSKYINAIAIGV